MKTLRTVDPAFSDMLRHLMQHRGVTYRALAERTFHGKSYLQDLASGKKLPTTDVAKTIDDALDARGSLAALVRGPSHPDDSSDLLELAQRVAASDVSPDTLDLLEITFDDLATGYATTPPAQLLTLVRRNLAHVSRLMVARKTLDQHRRLLVIGGWLALLGATLHIDLRQQPTAHALLGTADGMAGQAEHSEIRAWCLETQAWDVLTGGDYRRAIDLSQQAQALAPKGSSALIQATAQEGRAWARLQERGKTRAVLARVEDLVSSLPVPDRPEHHYRYDPDKALSYTATTLAWAGDPAAEDYARTVIHQLQSNGIQRPRRVASARMDLALALIAGGKLDEASAMAIDAIASGRVVASNWWRADEIMSAVARSGIREAADLREVYEEHRPAASH